MKMFTAMFLTSSVASEHSIETESRFVAWKGESALQLNMQAVCKILLLSSKTSML